MGSVVVVDFCEVSGAQSEGRCVLLVGVAENGWVADGELVAGGVEVVAVEWRAFLPCPHCEDLPWLYGVDCCGGCGGGTGCGGESGCGHGGDCGDGSRCYVFRWGNGGFGFLVL